jgi:hypothetical protein
LTSTHNVTDAVTPAKAGVQNSFFFLDSGFRRNDRWVYCEHWGRGYYTRTKGSNPIARFLRLSDNLSFPSLFSPPTRGGERSCRTIPISA